MPPRFSSLPSPLRFTNLLDHSLVDDLTLHISALLHRFSDTAQPELEGKLGLQLSPSTSHKLRIPSTLEQLLLLDPADAPHTFSADLPQRVFAHLNDRVLRGRFEAEQAQAKAEHRAPRMTYTHPITTDLFYSSSSSSNSTTRVTFPSSSTHPSPPLSPTSIVKQKLHHLDFLVPPLTSPTPPPPSIDFRITLSNESPVPLPPPSARPHRIRRKDRRSYAMDWWRVDCTMVETWQAVRQTTGGGAGWEGEGKSRVSYEVEVELVEAAVPRVRAEAAKVKAEGGGQSSLLVDIARNLLDNMRTLARVAVSPAPPSCQPKKATGDGKGVKRGREEDEVKDSR